jgi:2-polyprenyl-3-methyl-5-hydroxy-6-metoxy-1,4-benzoquinol methylase
LGKGAEIIDVGGGASVLVDHLLEAGYSRVAVLDISNTALSHARKRLGERATLVQWIEADVTAFVAPHLFALWHDRAVFHFLTHSSDRCQYVDALKRALVPTGHLIMATFAANGPQTCSGLDVCRYDAESIRREMGEEFRLLEHVDETHHTPSGAEQAFTYYRFRRRSR